MSFVIFNFALETLKLEWQCNQYLELKPTCVCMYALHGTVLLHYLWSHYQDNNGMHYNQLISMSVANVTLCKSVLSTTICDIMTINKVL